MKMHRYFMLTLLVVVSTACFAQKDLLSGHWVFVEETYNENMVKAYGPLAEYTNPDSICAKIRLEKKILLGSYNMVFSKGDQCESQGVKFKYKYEGNQLKLNWINYDVKVLNDKELLICEGEGRTCNRFYRQDYFKSLSKAQLDQTLAMNHYDSLVLSCILGRQMLTGRNDLFKVSGFPKYSAGNEKVDEVLAKNMAPLYGGLGDEQNFDLKYSFVLEPNGNFSSAGVDIMETV